METCGGLGRGYMTPKYCVKQKEKIYAKKFVFKILNDSNYLHKFVTGCFRAFVPRLNLKKTVECQSFRIKSCKNYCSGLGATSWLTPRPIPLANARFQVCAFARAPTSFLCCGQHRFRTGTPTGLTCPGSALEKTGSFPLRLLRSPGFRTLSLSRQNTVARYCTLRLGRNRLPARAFQTRF